MRAIIVAMLGLSLSGAVYAATACQPVDLTVVNSSSQTVSIRGAQGTLVVPANSTTDVSFESNHFYTKCGLIEVGVNDQSFQRGLIADSSKTVHVNVQINGAVEEVGLTQPGFNLDEYISWWGLGAVLG